MRTTCGNVLGRLHNSLFQTPSEAIFYTLLTSDQTLISWEPAAWPWFIQTHPGNIPVQQHQSGTDRPHVSATLTLSVEQVLTCFFWVLFWKDFWEKKGRGLKTQQLPSEFPFVLAPSHLPESQNRLSRLPERSSSSQQDMTTHTQTHRVVVEPPPIPASRCSWLTNVASLHVCLCSAPSSILQPSSPPEEPALPRDTHAVNRTTGKQSRPTFPTSFHFPIILPALLCAPSSLFPPTSSCSSYLQLPGGWPARCGVSQCIMDPVVPAADQALRC